MDNHDTTGRRVQPNTVESGSRLADRYRLEERLKAEDGFTTWRAVDEKLSRYVGVHVLPADHPRSKAVVQAAQAAAMLYDGRFCQVLDASQQADVIYVVEECLRGTYLVEQLSGGPLSAPEAAKLTREVAGALTAAHEAGLAHLRLHPENVLRTETGQIKVFGLSVEAALYGAESEDPAGADAHGLGALLYACLTARWPDGPGFGLAAAPHENGVLCSPRQVRAGVPAALDDIAMRALTTRPGAGPGPLRTPAEVAAALAAVPRLKPEVSEAPTQLNPALSAAAGAGYASPPPAYPAPQRPAGPSRTGKAVTGLVALLVLAGVVLFALSLANNALSGDGQPSGDNPQASQAAAGTPIQIQAVDDFDPAGKNSDGEEHPGEVDRARDGNPSTAWTTKSYNKASLPPFKPGVGLVVDLGKPVAVGSVLVNVGDSGKTSFEVRMADESTTSMPDELDSFTKVAEKSGASGEVTVSGDGKRTRFVLIWLTELPPDGGKYRGQIAEIAVRS